MIDLLYWRVDHENLWSEPKSMRWCIVNSKDQRIAHSLTEDIAIHITNLHNLWLRRIDEAAYADSISANPSLPF